MKLLVETLATMRREKKSNRVRLLRTQVELFYALNGSHVTNPPRSRDVMTCRSMDSWLLTLVIT